MDARGPEGGPVLLRVGRVSEVAAVLDSAGIRREQPVLVLVGGAGGMDERSLQQVEAVLREALLPAVAEHSAVVVDGGTDSGVMRAVGRARLVMGGDFPLVGVAAHGTIGVSTGPNGSPPAGGAAALEGHHTHVVLVPGESWGDESPWLANIADVVAGSQPSVTVLVNGGEISYADVAHSLAKGRRVVVLAGTGRTADAIAAAWAGGGRGDPRAYRIAQSELTQVVAVEDLVAIRAAVEAALSPAQRRIREQASRPQPVTNRADEDIEESLG